MVINLDFDGTLVTHEYPNVGKDIGSVPVLKRLVASGHKLILFTMRCDTAVKLGLFTSGLTDAVNWFKENDIPLYGIQRNPTQDSWTSSPKSYAQLMIDDSALGCPLISNPEVSSRPYVDWVEVEAMLEKLGLFK